MKDIGFKVWLKLPDAIRVPLDILRRRRYWNEAGVIFIHVPKAAGVSVSRALYGRPLGHFFARDIRRVCPVEFKDLPTFAVVRNPIDRLFSAYRFAKAGGTGEMGMANPELYQSEYFASFDKFVCEWLFKQDINRVDGVFKPQHLYFCNEDEVIVDKIIKLEQLDQGMREISTLIGRDIVFGHHNKSQELPFMIRSSETRKIIAHIYKKDFEILGYSSEQTSLLLST